MIRFCILDHDARYAGALADFMGVRYGSQVEPYLFHSLDSLRDYLQERRPDLILASDTMLPDPSVLGERTVAYLTEERTMERLNGRPAIFRYQSGERLLRQIKGAAAESDTRDAVYAAAEKGEAWLFVGAAGGVGCSTAAVGCAAQLAASGRKVLYLSLGSLGDLDGMLQGEGSGGLTRVLYEVKSYLGKEGQGNLAPKLESLVKYDPSLRVYFYEPFTLPLEAASLTGEEAVSLLRTLSGQYETVIVDVDAGYSPLLRSLLGVVGRIFLVSSGTDSANRRLSRMLDTFTVLEKQDDSSLLSKTQILYSRFGSAARRAEEKRVSALGVIQNYAGANSAGIAREIGGRDLFLTLRRS